MSGKLSGLAPQDDGKDQLRWKRNHCKYLHQGGLNWGYQSVGRSPTASASPGNMPEMQIPRPYPRPTETDPLDMGPRNLDLNKPVSQFFCMGKFENHWFRSEV